MTLDLSIIITTYQKPEHLTKVLESTACQKEVDGRFEVIVSDDGSTDETKTVVDSFRKRVDFHVGYVTHTHDGFQLARSRNEGAAQSRAPYLLFLDGDCVIPPDHLSQHLKHRRESTVMGVYCVRLDEATSERVTQDVIQSGEYQKWAPAKQLRLLRILDWKSRLYNWIRHPTKPKLFGGNIAIWRTDFEKVNGFDEKFVGWGCEDDDLRLRLRQCDVGIQSLLRWTRTYHLWHPPYETTPDQWREGANVQFIKRRRRLTRCINGLAKRSLDSLRLAVVGQPADRHSASNLLPEPWNENHETPEIEVLFIPGHGQFSGRAECNVAVVLDSSGELPASATEADLIFTPNTLTHIPASRQMPREDFREQLRRVA
ncbi:MAG: glycosyltransferase involved in cell wall biosynthesis [Pirellulaceae bacterium]|jgi:glycosyltransferase involved in cell wall biosynthesis